MLLTLITLQIFTTGGAAQVQKNRRGTGPPTEVSAYGAMYAARADIHC